MKFAVASVDSLMIYFGETIHADVAKEVRKAFFILKQAHLPELIEIIPSYTSIMVSYDFLKLDYDEACALIQETLEKVQGEVDEIPSRQMQVPVYYSEESGLDLLDLAKAKGLTPQEVIDIHTNRDYFVYAIGFFPGFPYMGEVDERIAMPRLANPRAKVPKGAVGIADRQTAVYPKESPGGWNIIGRTPIEMFDPSYEGLSYLRVGDKVRFVPISKEEYEAMGGVL